jgi:uncharacterized protein (DUF885 family)
MRAHLVLSALIVTFAMSLQAQTDSNFSKLAEQFMYESLALSPVNASYAGYHEYTDKKTGKVVELDAMLDDVSPAATQEQIKFYREWQHRFRTEIDPKKLNVEDQADWRLIDDNISLALLQMERMKTQQYQPQGYVETIGNALFLPLTQDYAPRDVRVGQVLSRMEQIPRFVEQTKQSVTEADPIFISTAKIENAGNIELIETTVKQEIPAGSDLEKRYNEVAPKAIAALRDLDNWLDNDLAKRPSTQTWRIGKDFYAEKFRLVMETAVTPDQMLATAEQDLKDVRAEMLKLALPMHKEMYPDHGDHSDLSPHERENRIISEVLTKISDDHCQRDKLVECVDADIAGIKQFIRAKKIVALSDRDNLKVIPTPPFMRGIYSVAGFHPAPPLDPNAEAQYWVTPIDPKATDAEADSKLREYNNYALKWLTIHEALPGHYIQFEHANNIQPANRRLLRNLFGNGAYIEGWAEYIAQVMMDEGFLDNSPKFRLVMRKLRLRLLGNTILDIKMQTMNMTDEQAMDLMQNECFQTKAEALGKLRRAKLTSTQLPTYYVGIKDWLQLRHDYQQKMGPKFSLIEFHNKALDEGPLPIMYLRQIIMPK